MSNQKKASGRRRQTRKEQDHERGLIEFVLGLTVGSRARKHPPAHVRVAPYDGQRRLRVDFYGAPPARPGYVYRAPTRGPQAWRLYRAPDRTDDAHRDHGEFKDED